jgi:bifunctional non-homologous end joining protein LigD
MRTKEVHLDDNTIEVSHPDKILYPDDGFTKADIVEYYSKVAPTMLPHIKDRPLSMQRFPNGIKAMGFYEKQIPDYFPDWVERVEIYVEEKDETQYQVVCNNAATLVYLADQACITPHSWLSRTGNLNYPDKMVFDLDPAGSNFETVTFAARAIRDLLDQIKMRSYLMTTGSRGLHVVVPLDGTSDFDASRDFARDLVEILARKEPKKLTTETHKNKRKGRLFLDYLRNSYAQTSVPPYALRAVSGAPVATPLEWEELDKPGLDAQKYTLKNIFQRLSRKKDPWRDFYTHAHTLDKHRKMLDDLSE